MKLRLAADHAGYDLKQHLAHWLKAQGHEVLDYGTHSPDSVDYPDFVHPLAQAMQAEPHALGILVCGSGNGVCLTANKYSHIRAALAWNPELAQLARQHNDANIICLPARFISIALAQEIVHAFLHTPFEGGRHQRRVDKIVPSSC